MMDCSFLSMLLGRGSEMFFRQYQIKSIEDIVDVFLSDNQWRLEGHDIGDVLALGDRKSTRLNSSH